MKPRLLQHGRLPEATEARLAEHFDVHPFWTETDPAAFLARHGSEFVALTTRAAIGADAALLAALPSLRVISSFGVGLDKLDLDSARRRGIAVGYTPDVLNDCVADTAFALLLDVSRKVSAADRFVRRGEWPKGQPFPLATRVSGKRLGIIGMGRIGRVIAHRSVGFDMEVRYHSRNPADDAPYPYEASLEALARWADYLVVATAGGPSTRHLVSAAVLDALGPQGFLINIARGTVVDEAALVDALAQQRIAGAGLDVFEDEPNVPEALFGLDNVVVLPHIASATHETRQAMAELVFENLQRFFATGAVKKSAI
ncbi:hydroxyacid dehydrogenase [Cupriavidus sp. TA19]|uniref:2-hydroxyacid dehydrogenase n=1 Tax=unclassified Cupriavidus TaxID=2640874 RepID=UPI000E2F3DFD|nr:MULTISPECIES: 2-hydroxyacid dehydrogenase [unclassified Cupriavidus]BDB24127.1 2-hydroxyacid dehydrogenase [Cupriavidus sp. P-10]GLC98051.1 hydroxyacid dehydrogenase [Cupriavidus sp. TA19]